MKKLQRITKLQKVRNLATRTPSEAHDFKEAKRTPDEFEFSENRPEDDVDKVDFNSLMMKFESDSRKYFEEMKKKCAHPNDNYLNDFESNYEKIFNEFKSKVLSKK